MANREDYNRCGSGWHGKFYVKKLNFFTGDGSDEGNVSNSCVLMDVVIYHKIY